MPNRIIKESICASETIDELTWFEEVLFYRLMVKVDDFGRYDGRVKILKGNLFPLKDVTVKDIEKALNKLSAVGLVDLYTVNGHPYLQLRTWSEHQTIRNKKSKYPSIEDRDPQLNANEINCNQLHANVPVIQSNPIQSNPNPNTNRFTPPTLEDVKAYCEERNNNVDPQKWFDYYTANGWMVGKNKMKDWKASVRTWEKNSFTNKPQPKKQIVPDYMLEAAEQMNKPPKPEKFLWESEENEVMEMMKKL